MDLNHNLTIEELNFSLGATHDNQSHSAYNWHYRSSHACISFLSTLVPTQVGFVIPSVIEQTAMEMPCFWVSITSAITTSRLEGLRSGLPKTHPTILGLIAHLIFCKSYCQIVHGELVLIVSEAVHDFNTLL